MSIEQCPTCLAAMPARAAYCPRCGRPRWSGVPPACPTPRVSGGQLIAGYIVYSALLVAGFAMNRLAALEEEVPAIVGVVFATVGVLGLISLAIESSKRRRKSRRAA